MTRPPHRPFGPPPPRRGEESECAPGLLTPGGGSVRRSRTEGGNALFALVLLSLALPAAPALAQDSEPPVIAGERIEDPEAMYEAAWTAFELNDFATAHIAATAAASEGHAEAMTLLGFMHEKGLGGLRDEVKAIEWYRAAAEKDEPEALVALAAYAVESELGLSPADARGFLERAIGAGRPDAAIDLAKLHLEGLGGPPDRARGLELLDSAAREDPDSAFRAGVMLTDLDAGSETDAKAAGYLARAAEAGHAAAATHYGHALYHGVGLAADKPEAARWYAEAAERGDTEGQVYHALMLAGVDADLEGAAYWLARSRLSEGPEDLVSRYAPVRGRLDAALEDRLPAELLEAARERARRDVGA